MTFLRITQLMNAEAEPEAGALGKSDSSSNDTLSSPQPSLFLPLACTLPWQLFNLLHNTSNGLDSNWFTKLIFHEVRKKKYTNQTKITLSIIGAVERGQKSHLWSRMAAVLSSIQVLTGSPSTQAEPCWDQCERWQACQDRIQEQPAHTEDPGARVKAPALMGLPQRISTRKFGHLASSPAHSEPET